MKVFITTSSFLKKKKLKIKILLSDENQKYFKQKRK